MIADSIKWTYIKGAGANYTNWQWLFPREEPLLGCAISLSRSFNISQQLCCLQGSEEPVSLPPPFLDVPQLGATVGSSSSGGKTERD